MIPAWPEQFLKDGKKGLNGLKSTLLRRVPKDIQPCEDDALNRASQT